MFSCLCFGSFCFTICVLCFCLLFLVSLCVFLWMGYHFSFYLSVFWFEKFFNSFNKFSFVVDFFLILVSILSMPLTRQAKPFHLEQENLQLLQVPEELHKRISSFLVWKLSSKKSL